MRTTEEGALRYALEMEVADAVAAHDELALERGLDTGSLEGVVMASTARALRDRLLGDIERADMERLTAVARDLPRALRAEGVSQAPDLSSELNGLTFGLGQTGQEGRSLAWRVASELGLDEGPVARALSRASFTPSPAQGVVDLIASEDGLQGWGSTVGAAMDAACGLGQGTAAAKAAEVAGAWAERERWCLAPERSFVEDALARHEAHWRHFSDGPMTDGQKERVRRAMEGVRADDKDAFCAAMNEAMAPYCAKREMYRDVEGVRNLWDQQEDLRRAAWAERQADMAGRPFDVPRAAVVHLPSLAPGLRDLGAVRDRGVVGVYVLARQVPTGPLEAGDPSGDWACWPTAQEAERAAAGSERDRDRPRPLWGPRDAACLTPLWPYLSPQEQAACEDLWMGEGYRDGWAHEAPSDKRREAVERGREVLAWLDAEGREYKVTGSPSRPGELTAKVGSTGVSVCVLAPEGRERSIGRVSKGADTVRLDRRVQLESNGATVWRGDGSLQEGTELTALRFALGDLKAPAIEEGAARTWHKWESGQVVASRENVDIACKVSHAGAKDSSWKARALCDRAAMAYDGAWELLGGTMPLGPEGGSDLMAEVREALGDERLRSFDPYDEQDAADFQAAVNLALSDYMTRPVKCPPDGQVRVRSLYETYSEEQSAAYEAEHGRPLAGLYAKQLAGGALSGHVGSAPAATVRRAVAQAGDGYVAATVQMRSERPKTYDDAGRALGAVAKALADARGRLASALDIEGLVAEHKERGEVACPEPTGDELVDRARRDIACYLNEWDGRVLLRPGHDAKELKDAALLPCEDRDAVMDAITYRGRSPRLDAYGQALAWQADALDEWLGPDPASEGWAGEFDPVRCAAYMGSSQGLGETAPERRDNLIRAARGAGLTVDDLLCEDSRAFVAERMAAFDEATARPMGGTPFMDARKATVMSALEAAGLLVDEADVMIDGRGVVSWKGYWRGGDAWWKAGEQPSREELLAEARAQSAEDTESRRRQAASGARRVKAPAAERWREASGTIGQVVEPDADGIVHLLDADGGSKDFIPYWRAHIVEGDAPVETRVRLVGHAEQLDRAIGARLTWDALTAMACGDKLFGPLEDPAGLNREAYGSDLLKVRLSPDDKAYRLSHGWSEESVGRLYRTMGQKVVLEKRYEDAGIRAQVRACTSDEGVAEATNDGAFSAFARTGCVNTALVSGRFDGMFDPSAKPQTSKDQTRVFYLVDGAEVDGGGRVVPAPPLADGSPARCAAIADPFFKNEQFDPHDRFNMSLTAWFHARSMERCGVAEMNMGGFAYEDAVVVSADFAARAMVRPDGRPAKDRLAPGRTVEAADGTPKGAAGPDGILRRGLLEGERPVFSDGTDALPEGHDLVSDAHILEGLAVVGADGGAVGSLTADGQVASLLSAGDRIIDDDGSLVGVVDATGLLERPLQVGDKLEDADGNKGTVSLIVDPADDREAGLAKMMGNERAYEDVYRRLQAGFAANPGLDVVAGPHSLVSRQNFGRARNMMESPHDLFDPEGERIGTWSDITMMVTDATVDAKGRVHDEHGEDRRGRKFSPSYGYAMAEYAPKRMAEVFRGNEEGLNRLRGSLRVCGMDVAQDGTLVEGIDPGALEGACVAGCKVPAVRDGRATPRSSFRAAASRQLAQVARTGGFVCLPFDPTAGADGKGQGTPLAVAGADGRLRAVPEGAELEEGDEVRGWALWVPPESMRREAESLDGSKAAHDWTRHYLNICTRGAIRAHRAEAGAEAPSAYDRAAHATWLSLRRQVTEQKLSGKANSAAEDVLSRRVGDSFTLPVVPMPYIDPEDVVVGDDTMETTRCREGQVVTVHRDPLLHKGGRVAAHAHGSRTARGVMKVNPLICGPLGLDFDGDTMGGQVSHDEEVNAELMESFGPRQGMLKWGLKEDGSHPLAFSMGTEVNNGIARRPELAGEIERGRVEANEAARLPRGPERALAERRALGRVSNAVQEAFMACAWRDANDYSSPEAAYESILENAVVNGGKGSQAKLDAAFRRGGFEVAHREDGATELCDAGRTLLSRAERDESNIATDVKIEYTSAGGQDVKDHMLLMRGSGHADAAQEADEVKTQRALDAKHDAETGMTVAVALGKIRPMVNAGAICYEDADGHLGVRWPSREEGKDPILEREAYMDGCVTFYTSKEGLGASPDDVEREAFGHIWEAVKTKGSLQPPLLDALALGGDPSVLEDYVGKNLFGPEGSPLRNYAPASVRAAWEGADPAEAKGRALKLSSQASARVSPETVWEFCSMDLGGEYARQAADDAAPWKGRAAEAPAKAEAKAEERAKAEAAADVTDDGLGL